MSLQRRASASADEFAVETVQDTPVCRERLARFLELDHPALPELHDLEVGSGEIRLVRRRRQGDPLSELRLAREPAASVLLQTAAALIFFASRGFPLDSGEIAGARVERWAGAAHFWLAATPRSVLEEPLAAEPGSAALAETLARLFPPRGRGPAKPADPSASKLLECLLTRLRAPARPDRWIVEIFESFPFLGDARHASVRRRCAGYRPAGFDERERRHRARAIRARFQLEGHDPQLFVPGESPLLPGEAVRASLGRPEREGGSAALAEILGREAGGRSPWIRVDSERWDAASRHAFAAAAGRGGVEVVEVRGPSACRPDELRDAVWLPTPDLASSVALYESLNAAVRRNPSALRRGVARFLASEDFARYLRGGGPPEFLLEAEPELARRDLSQLSPEERRAAGIFLVNPACGGRSDPDGRSASGAFARAAARLASRGWLEEDTAAGGWRVPDPSSRADLLAGFSEEEVRSFHDDWLPHLTDPLLRADFASRARRPELLKRAAEEIFAGEPSGPSRRRELDPVSRLVVEGLGSDAPPRARAHEAQRLSEGGDPVPARAIWESLAADPACPREIARDARFRLAASWERSRGSARGRGLLEEILAGDPEPEARSRAARGLCRMAIARGDFAEALARLEAAEAIPDSPESERLETALLRADFHSRRGELDLEREIFDRTRARVRACGLEELQRRYLLHEGMSLSDRREHEAAALRFSEALACAGADPAARGAALMDLAIARDNLGDAGGSEAHFLEARRWLEGCGDGALKRCATGNLASFYLDHRREADAEPLIRELLAESERDGDRVGRLAGLAARARLLLRLGQFAGAAADRKEALALCERIEDRVARAELEIEESDGRLFGGEPGEAVAYARRAASRPADRGPATEQAAGRLADLERWSADREVARAFPAEEIETALRQDPASAAERVARARAFFGEALEKEHGPACFRARAILEDLGRGAFAASVFGSRAADSGAVRDLCDRIRRGELPADLTALVAEALETSASPPSAESPPGSGLEICRRVGILTADPSLEALGLRLARIATQNVTVFVSGESGTGKERVARAVHELSPRARRPFVPVNVAAFPEHLLEEEIFGHVRGAFTGADRDRAGLFEAAQMGTLFLDEVGDLPATLQAKLLRVLQEREIKRIGENRYRPVDVRLISATARNLETEVEAGRFREDLYYRLKVATIHLPPLRERGGDALLLARHFLDRYAAEYSRGSLRFTPRAAGAIRDFSWPGNVRQLQNAVMEAAALADPDSSIDRDGLPPFLRPSGEEEPGSTYRQRVAAFRRRIVAEALARRAGNRTHAARDLGLTRQALLYLIRELEIRG
jgi:DNA-binding NtrC family response regulator